MPHRVAGAEYARLSTLYRYGVLDTERDLTLDAIVEMVARRLNVPVVQLVFADAQRFWAKAGLGEVDAVQLRGRGPLDDLLGGGPAFLALRNADEGLPRGEVASRSFAGLRLVGADDEMLGILYVADAGGRDFSIEAPEILAGAAVDILAILESGRRSREDEATGALKRDPFLDQARRLIQVSRRGRQWISLVTLDLAPFRAALESKAVGLGSLMMRHMADLGRTQVRRRDSFGRLEDDLFAVLLTDTAEAGAQVLAQRLARHLERGWTDAGLAASGLDLGMASLKPSNAENTPEQLLAQAVVRRWTPAEAPPQVRVA